MPVATWSPARRSTPPAAAPGCCSRWSAATSITDGWRSTEVRDALDLCLACKGCKSDCPVNVDMATYKAEFLAHHYRAGCGRRRTTRWAGSRCWPRSPAGRTGAGQRRRPRAPALARLLKRLGGDRPGARPAGLRRRNRSPGGGGAVAAPTAAARHRAGR